MIQGIYTIEINMIEKSKMASNSHITKKKIQIAVASAMRIKPVLVKTGSG